MLPRCRCDSADGSSAFNALINSRLVAIEDSLRARRLTMRVPGFRRKMIHGILARSSLALVAVARKMLHAIFGMFRSNCNYDGSRLLPNLEIPTLTALA